jgi:glycosyltransferase involved in cell wall biosynthesis
MVAMLSFLADLGCKVTFVPVQDGTKWELDTGRLQQKGIEVLYGLIDVADLLKRRRSLFDTVIVSRPHNACRVASTIRTLLPDAILIYDAEALYYRRQLMQARLEGREEEAGEILRLRQTELELIASADKVIAVSDKDKEFIVRESGREHDIFIWGHAHETHQPLVGFSKRRDLLFVGGFLGSRSPNEDAVLYFVRDVFPKIRRALPDIRLVIIGADPPEPIRDLRSDSVSVVGYVRNPRRYYERCRVFVNPTRYAAGIPLKLIEAMSFGIPTVVTDVAAAGLGLKNNEQALVCTTDEELAKKTIALYQNEDLWLQVQRAALAYVRESCNPSALKASLAEIID